MSKRGLTQHEKELYNIIISLHDREIEIVKLLIKCITLFAIVWWLSYMFTPYLTKNYVNESNNVVIKEE